ncbi:unnamed protein product [Oreochromis niloticus]|nr:unnamed protein product [Mustela putorius furo]
MSDGDQENITADSKQNVNLTCQVPNKTDPIIVVEWSRADLLPEYVFVYRTGKPVPDDQHPSFKNRVDLQDRQMKDRDVSLILKNVTINDTGTYECHVFMSATTVRLKTKPICIIYLSVVDPPAPPSCFTLALLSVANRVHLSAFRTHVTTIKRTRGKLGKLGKLSRSQTGGDTEDGSVGLKVGLPLLVHGDLPGPGADAKPLQGLPQTAAQFMSKNSPIPTKTQSNLK